MTAAIHPRPGGEDFFTSHARSDVGQARKGNEDNYYMGVTVFAVADGMGGHQAGEVASETALISLQAVDERAWPSDADAEHALADAVRAANTQVVEQAAANPDYRGMGTTLTAILVREGRLLVAHVGDSRAYLFRPGEGMSQLTTDHTLVEQLVRDGRISRDDIPTHPQRSVITRAIGVESFVEVDTLTPLELQPGDQVLLCSDGLSGPVGDDQIAAILAGTPDGEEACDALVRAANRAGGPDNITVVLLRVGGGAQADSGGARAVRVPVGPNGAEMGEATGELGGGTGAAGVHRISTRSDSGTDFDPDALVRYGAGREERLAPEEELPTRSVSRVLLGVLATVAVLSAVAVAGIVVWSGSWFIGVEDGEVAIFQGAPGEVAGIRTARLAERTGLRVSELSSAARAAVSEGLGESSRNAARNRIAGYQRDIDRREREARAEAAASESPRPTPGPTPTPTPSAQPGPTPTPELQTPAPPPSP